ncbi:hypothetical protein SRABI76_01835 [Microbacterium oxydans]|uniref:hypothetical protein n=1 Tax=Microbacterium oxydans TaxID=82380 RepID=UPI001D9EAE61|nr:hypothetical protein [Microbacterium oxydans]CAH0193578.1 hypothetical protein SRABI76_01835 [Microbacterium oxydans]
MSEQQTMVRTKVEVNGVGHLLAQDQDVTALKLRLEAAARTSGTFVDFVVVGNRNVSVLVTPHTQIVVSVATVLHDVRDTGDETQPFGGFYDL